MTFAPNLYIHPHSRARLEQFVDNPSHGLILAGSPGVGLTTIAKHLAEALSPEQPFSIVGPIDDKDVTIEQVRALYADTHSVQQHKKVVIVDDAHTMSLPAQNAFLKLLEEPPNNVHFVLVAHEPSQLLPTIHSRAELVEVRPLQLQQLQECIASFTNDATLQAQLAFLAPGYPAKVTALAQNAELFEQESVITRDARQFIQGDSYTRLIVANSYGQQRNKAIGFVTMIGQLLTHMMRKQADDGHKLAVITTVIDHLHDNANVKLQLTKLSLTL
jgi:DNA polymerase III delta prime subunit